MWAVTARVIVIWLRVTALVALGVAAVWWWGSPGWFTASCIAAVIVEVWTVRQLAREWSWQARGRWWWSA